MTLCVSLDGRLKTLTCTVNCKPRDQGLGVNAWWDLGLDTSQNEINQLSFFFKVKLSKWAKTKLPKIWVSWLYRIIMSSNIRETSLSWNCKGKVFCKISFLYYFKFCICNSHRKILLFFFFKIKRECVMLIISNILQNLNL